MARRLIGLDVGTNAVTIAEVTPGSPPRLDMFAQVALPREAMREGEVADESAVSDAVARLRAEVGIKKAAVRVGLASPRVVVRQVEMPVMTRDELASALQFQAGDLIPIPVEDAVLDFSILGTTPAGEGDGGEPTMQVLLAAVQEATVMRLVSAVEAGGLQVAAVDLVPLALIRALAGAVPAMATVGTGGVALADEPVGAESIVSFGGGVTAIAVHEGGIPRFVRVLGSGGRELTDAIASDLEVPADMAEALKRQIGTGNDELVLRARNAIDRPLSVLLDEVRSSIDYYRNQPGASRLLRVVATGGSSQLPGLPERLSALVGVPVENADLREVLRVGDIGFAPDELPRLEPYVPAAVGLALGGAGVGTVVDLLPRTRHTTRRSAPALDKRVLAVAGVALVALGGLTFMAHSDESSAKSKKADAAAQVQRLESELAQLTPSATGGSSVGNLQATAMQALAGDVAWPRLVDDVGNVLPGGVLLTALQGQHTLAPTTGPSAPTTAGSTAGATGSTGSTSASGASGSTPAVTTPSVPAPVSPCAQTLDGTVTLAGIAKDLPSIAAFLDALEKSDADIAGTFVTTVQKSQFGTEQVLAFTANAVLMPGARSDRLQQFFKEQTCK